MSVELIYDRDDVNVAKARWNLCAAMSRLGQRAQWTENKRGASAATDAKRLVVPMILVDGHEVTDAAGPAEEVPGVGRIEKALRAGGGRSASACALAGRRGRLSEGD